eukprot:IDg15451t1
MTESRFTSAVRLQKSEQICSFLSEVSIVLHGDISFLFLFHACSFFVHQLVALCPTSAKIHHGLWDSVLCEMHYELSVLLCCSDALYTWSILMVNEITSKSNLFSASCLSFEFTYPLSVGWQYTVLAEKAHKYTSILHSSIPR